MSDFYTAFEDRFRGSRETIKARMRQYLPFIRALRAARGASSGIDLGCGRGEWLELLRDEGIDALGIDAHEGMLEPARRMGLQVQVGGAVAALESQPPESRDIVSAFHLVEHLDFEELQTLVREALRVLRPGGLLVMETPDAGNPWVGISSFYLDPTHRRPIPAGLLAFLPEHSGFRRVKILRFQELAGLGEKPAPSLLNVLRDASADVAVIAQKAGDEPLMAGLDPAFDREYGVTMDVLAARYDAAIEARVRKAETSAAQSAARVEQLLDSHSWRATAPLRWIGEALQRLFGRSGR